MSESFKFGLAGEQYKAKMGNTIVCLFRERPEVDYFKVIDRDAQEAVYIFNNQELARQIGGFVLQGDFDGVPTHYPDSEFKARYGWNAPTIIEDKPRDYEKRLFKEANEAREAHEREELIETEIQELDERPPWLP